MTWSETVRAPAVAGRFYPDDPDRLHADVLQRMASQVRPIEALAVVGPHAGYIYSGPILGETYARVEIPRTVVILCPNHTGLGVRRSIWSGGSWRLPSGDVPIDRELAQRVATLSSLEWDQLAHLREHAIEVHLPFLQARRPDLRIVPICLAGLDVAACREVGTGLASAAMERDVPTLIVASTDMSHYLPAAEAERLDRLALDRVAALDPEGLHQTVRAHQISMCGYVPTTVALFAAKALGARKAELVRYGNSGEESGDYTRVVGYAGFVIC